jgi:hypothetical protein
MVSVPFTIPNLYGCLGDCHGMLRADGTCLVLEFQVQDNILGWFRGSPQTVRLPLSELESVELKKSWFRSSDLVITAKSLLSVAAVPGSRQGRITLRIDRKDLPAAAEFVDNAYESSGGT